MTKTKTIEFALPGGGAKSASDIVGVELFAPGFDDCAAVRLAYRKKAWHLVAAGAVKGPKGELPERWEDTPHQPTWELPHDYTSPHAALAVHSPMGQFSQSTPDAVVQEMMNGLGALPTPGSPARESGKKRFGIRRDASAAPASTSAAPLKTSLKVETPARRPEFPRSGESVSENGRRFVVRPMAEEGFHLCASLPEFQTLWLSRLLPEGRRPTASSIQVADSALMASVLLQPEFRAAGGSALAIFVRRDAVFFAGYKKGEGVLWRRCPSVGGSDEMRMAVKRTLGVDDELVDSVLNESLVDPRPALEPFVRPVLSQLELSLAYLASKHSLRFDHAFLMGLDAGSAHWSAYAEESLRLKLISPDPFDGLVRGKGADAPGTSRHLVALGAAIAGSEATL
ncbi:MAG: hypothetical protein IJ829_08840 [Kiritimatiellae bacterium]|nr:hypothetical protein [Kiritimatiellia bacterium]